MFLVKPNEAQMCTNILLDSLVGGIIRRPGWEYIYNTHELNTTIRTIYPFIDAAGNSFLLSTHYRSTHSSDEIWYNSNETFSPKYPRLSIQQADLSLYPDLGNWVTWNGRAFYFDGHSNGRVLYHGTGALSDSLLIDFAPPPAPGQPVVKPYLIGPAGPQDGEYVYAFMVDVPCSTNYHWSRRCGTMSPPIKLNKERALITCFPYDIDDTLCTASSIARVALCRTLANRYGPDDTLYVVDTIATSTPWTTEFIDTMSDSTLNNIAKVMGRIGVLAYNELDKKGDTK